MNTVSTKKQCHIGKKSPRRTWLDIPISNDVMAMTFNQRKPVGDYREILERELKERYNLR